MPKIEYEITANTSDVTSQIAALTKRLDSLESSGDDAAQSMDSLADENKKAATAAKKQSAATKDLDKDLKDNSKTTESAKKLADGLGGAFGETAGRAQNLSEGISGLTASLSPAGIAVLGVAGGLLAGAGMVAGLVAATMKVIELTDAAAESVKDLDRFQAALAIDAETVEGVESAATSIDVVRLTAEKLNIEFVSGLSPSIREVSALIIAFGLASIDAAKFTVQYADAFVTLVNFALRPATMATLALLEAQLAISEVLGVKVSPATHEWVEELRNAVLPVQSIGKTMDDTAIAFGGYYSAAQSTITVTQEQARASQLMSDSQAGAASTIESTTAEIEEQAEAIATVYAPAVETISTGWVMNTEAYNTYAEGQKVFQEEEIESFGERLAAQEEFHAQIKAATVELGFALADMAQALADRRIEILEEGITKTQSALDADKEMFLKHGADLTQAERDQLHERVKQNQEALKVQEAAKKKAALTSFRIGQAEALADVGIRTFQGIQAALTIPPPAGIVLAAVVGATGIANGIAIAAQKPPTFRIGGMVPDDAPALPGGNRDQRLIAAEPGEMILNQEQQSALSGGGGVFVIEADGLFERVNAKQASREMQNAVARNTEIGMGV